MAYLYIPMQPQLGVAQNILLNPIFKFQGNQIFDIEGENDSFVSVESAQWGQYLGCINLSHLNQINVQVGRDLKSHYYDFWTGVIKKLSEFGH